MHNQKQSILLNPLLNYYYYTKNIKDTKFFIIINNI